MAANLLALSSYSSRVIMWLDGRRGDMRTFGLLEAKQKLSELVERASTGEQIGITRRGKLAAMIVPARPTKTLDEVWADIEDIRKRVDRSKFSTIKELIELLLLLLQIFLPHFFRHLGLRGKVLRISLEHRHSFLRSQRAIMHRNLMRLARTVTFPERHAGVCAIFAKDIVGHVDEAKLVHVAVVVSDDTLKRVHAGLLRRHSVTHILDDGVSAGALDIFLAAAGRSRRSHVLIGIASGTDDGRIPATARQL